MKRRTEEQKTQRAQDIEDAFYAVRRALSAEKLCIQVPYYRTINGRKVNTKRPEFQVLCDTITDRAVDMMLKAFDGEVHGKKVPKTRKAP